MSEKEKLYFEKMIAGIVCDKTTCNGCDFILCKKETDDCPDDYTVDTDEYNEFVVDFAEILYRSVMQGKNLHFRDWQEIDTTEILNFLKGK